VALSTVATVKNIADHPANFWKCEKSFISTSKRHNLLADLYIGSQQTNINEMDRAHLVFFE
jgi:hypothetical protein